MANHIISADTPVIEPQASHSRTHSFVRLESEHFASYSHFFGVILSLLGILLLLQRASSNSDILLAVIYTLSNVILFGCSGFYHALKQEENEISVWRKLDHIAIFIMIAGTYTPICFIYLEGFWKWGIIIVQWSLVICGLVLKLMIMNTPRYITTGIYLLQGWMAILPLYQLFKSMSALSLVLMAVGGILYTIGAIIYNKKKPNPLPGKFGFHEIFHVLILMGATTHYLVILFAISLNS